MVIVSWAKIGVAPKAENRKRRIVQRLYFSQPNNLFLPSLEDSG
jgi:hypothetical protein